MSGLLKVSSTLKVFTISIIINFINRKICSKICLSSCRIHGWYVSWMRLNQKSCVRVAPPAILHYIPYKGCASIFLRIRYPQRLFTQNLNQVSSTSSLQLGIVRHLAQKLKICRKHTHIHTHTQLQTSAQCYKIINVISINGCVYRHIRGLSFVDIKISINIL